MSYVQAVMDSIKEEIERARGMRDEIPFVDVALLDQYISGLEKAMQFVIDSK